MKKLITISILAMVFIFNAAVTAQKQQEFLDITREKQLQDAYCDMSPEQRKEFIIKLDKERKLMYEKNLESRKSTQKRELEELEAYNKKQKINKQQVYPQK